MLAVVVAYHKNDKGYTDRFENMLKSIDFKNNEKNIFITLDGATPDYIASTVEKFKLLPENIIYSETNVGNYVLKFKFIESIGKSFRYVKFCDFDDKSATYKKMLRICQEYKDSDLIVCRSSKWSFFVNYWDKIFSTKLLSKIPQFKCFTGGDVIICWDAFYNCFKYDMKYSLCGEMIYFKTKEASRTCREKKPDESGSLESPAGFPDT